MFVSKWQKLISKFNEQRRSTSRRWAHLAGSPESVMNENNGTSVVCVRIFLRNKKQKFFFLNFVQSLPLIDLTPI
jgi:hypothetical protein